MEEFFLVSSLELFLISPSEKEIKNVSSFQDKDFLFLFLTSNYYEILKKDYSKKFLSFFSQILTPTENFVSSLEKIVEECSLVFDKNILLCLGVTLLQSFIQDNWTGPSLTFSLQSLIVENISKEEEKKQNRELTKCLDCNGETFYRLTKSPFCLLLAKTLLNHLVESNTLKSSCWWLARALFCHQLLLDNNVQKLHDFFFKLMSNLMCSEWLQKDETKELLIQTHIECVSAFHYYGDSVKATVLLSNYFRISLVLKEHLKKAKEIAKVSMNLTGILGKRTKFQENSIAQLSLVVHSTEIKENQKSQIPEDIMLEDDLLHHSIQYEEQISNKPLSFYDQLIILASCINIKNTNPEHGLTSEQMLPYVNSVLQEKENSNWTIFSLALLIRSRLEQKHMRKAERACLQIKALVDQFENSKYQDGPVSDRIRFIYSTPYPPKHILLKELGMVYLSLGCSRSAQEIFKELELWEDLVSCYLISGDKTAALEVVNKQMKIEETPLLHCLIGEITGNPNSFEKAWELSSIFLLDILSIDVLVDKTYSKAMRLLGKYYVYSKEYLKAIDCFQLALVNNPIFPSVFPSISLTRVLSFLLDIWFSMGYSAMMIQNWSVAKKAFKSSLSFDNDNFEGWNNLGAVLIQTNELKGAKKALEQAVKCNHSSWRTWENLLHVCLLQEELSMSLFSILQIIEIQNKFNDMNSLTILMDLVLSKLKQSQHAEYESLFQLTSEVLEKVSQCNSSNPTIWALYSEWNSFLGNSSKKCEYLQKAYRASQVAGWEDNVELLKIVCHYALLLSNEYVATNEKLFLHKARLMLNGIIKKTQEKHSEHDFIHKIVEERNSILNLEQIIILNKTVKE